MAELGKPKWFHKLGHKPSSKHQNAIIGPVQHIRVLRDFSFSNIKKSKIAEKSYNSKIYDKKCKNYTVKNNSNFFLKFNEKRQASFLIFCEGLKLVFTIKISE
jgi:hypothetical protein